MADKALQEPAFLVLTALAGGPQHGYGLVEDVLRVSDGQVRLHTGTLYAILDRLREGGLIEVHREEIVESRLRRYYQGWTNAGAERLATEAERMRRNASAAASRLRQLAAQGSDPTCALACGPREAWHEPGDPGAPVPAAARLLPVRLSRRIWRGDAGRRAGQRPDPARAGPIPARRPT